MSDDDANAGPLMVIGVSSILLVAMKELAGFETMVLVGFVIVLTSMERPGSGQEET